MNICICCHNSLLRHVRQGDIHWFCPQCRQDMPSTELDASNHSLVEQEEDISQPVEAIPLVSDVPVIYALN